MLHHTAEIVAVGTELLLGSIANTNAQYLSQELNALGIGVCYHTVVGTIRSASGRSWPSPESGQTSSSPPAASAPPTMT